MITPSFSLDLLSTSLDSRVAFTRATSASNPATFVNSNGVIEDATNNQPRFDFDPVTLICRGLLVEESKTNNYSNSSNFSAWNKGNLSISSDVIAAPDGTTTGDKLIPNTVNTDHLLGQLFILSTTTHTITVYAKKAEYDWICLFGVNFANARAFFNVNTGALGNVTGTGSPVASIQNAGDGWYRCRLSFTASASNANYGISPANANGSTFFAGNNTNGVFIWGAQLEAGAFATSYIPTTTTAVTRNADVATITGTAFSGFWRSGPGSILVRALPSTVSGTRPLIQFDDNTADNIIALRGNTTDPELYIRAGGSDQATIDAGAISAAAYRLAGTWVAGNAAASLNSGAAVLGAPGAIPAATQARLGSDGTNYLNGHLQAVEYWDSKLSNTTLRMASSTAGRRSLLKPIITPII